METLMLINHKEAIRFLVDGINRMEISVDNIRSLHYLLADGLVQPEDAGQVRRSGVRTLWELICCGCNTVRHAVS